MDPSEDPIYLDHNATTPVLPAVLDAMLPYLREHFGNPSSGHVYGKRARDAVENARAQVASLLGSAPDEVLFTGGGTEANNLALVGASEARAPRRKVVTTKLEHPATLEPLTALAARGWELSVVGVTPAGRVDLDALSSAVDERTAMVSVMHAQNETGALQPVAEAAAMARAKGALSHTDAAQSVGKVPIDVRALGVDLLSVAGHKLYAPKGVGALYVRRGVSVTPVVRGAGHERGLRPGTENVAGVVGLGAACALAQATMEAEVARVTALRERLWERLRAEVAGIARTGEGPWLPNTLHVRFPRVSGNSVLAAAPSVAASTGSACHGDHDDAPPVLLAMGVPAWEAVGAVRLTLGRGTTEAEVDRAAAALAKAWRGFVDEG